MKSKVLKSFIAIMLSVSLIGCGGNTYNSNQTSSRDENTVPDESVQDNISDKETPDNGIVEDNEKKELADEKAVIVTAEDENSELTTTQLNSINMLNYMTVLTQQINESKGNQIFLESARSALYNDTNLNAVDTKTQAQITQLVGVIDNYRMIDVKRDRLEYINEQNRAQAMRQAIPNPVGLLSAVQSGSMLKAAASVLYMAVDSASSYTYAMNQAEQQYIKEGWELDDEEMKSLQSSTTAQFNYMCNMVRDYDLPGDYVVRDDDIKNFVTWTKKTNLVSKITWFEDNEKTYSKFRPYWIELIKDYYDAEEYEKCIAAAHQYEMISTRIIRKDIDYANVLPMIIISAKETMTEDEYVKLATEYCSLICENTKDADWSLRYFVAQIYIDIYALTHDNEYLEKAYDIAKYNVNIMVEEQRAMNVAYLSPIKEVKAEKDATKREKEEVKQYNKLLKEERKIALPPVSEALYLNCDLLFSLMEQLGNDPEEMEEIEAILHENDDNTFLTEALDKRFRYGNESDSLNLEDIRVDFDGDEIEIPAIFISDHSKISVVVTNKERKTDIEDWIVSKVDRNKKTDCSEFMVFYKSKEGKSYKYKDGETVKIIVTPVIESPEDTIIFNYDVVGKKIAFFFNEIKFERK